MTNDLVQLRNFISLALNLLSLVIDDLLQRLVSTKIILIDAKSAAGSGAGAAGAGAGAAGAGAGAGGEACVWLLGTAKLSAIWELEELPGITEICNLSKGTEPVRDNDGGSPASMTADEDDREERDPARDGLREGDPARRPRSKWIGEERVERMRSGETETSKRRGTEREIRRLRRGLRKERHRERDTAVRRGGDSGKTEAWAAKGEAQRERYGGEERRESPARLRRGLRKEKHRERDTAERRGGRVRRDLTGDVRLRGEHLKNICKTFARELRRQLQRNCDAFPLCKGLAREICPLKILVTLRKNVVKWKYKRSASATDLLIRHVQKQLRRYALNKLKRIHSYPKASAPKIMLMHSCCFYSLRLVLTIFNGLKRQSYLEFIIIFGHMIRPAPYAGYPLSYQRFIQRSKPALSLCFRYKA
ncbi:hypothetical protein YC2023_043268 [Brassica napus]